MNLSPSVSSMNADGSAPPPTSPSPLGASPSSPPSPSSSLGSAPPPASAPSAAYSQRPPLRRSRHGMIAGVAEGVARHLGVEVKAVRLGLVLTAFIGGIGALMYMWLWLAVPEEDDIAADAQAHLRLAAPLTPVEPNAGKGSAHSGWSGLKRLVFIALIGLIVFFVLFVWSIAGEYFSHVFNIPILGYVPQLFLIAVGVVLIWAQLSDSRAAGGQAMIFIVCGALLVFIGGGMLIYSRAGAFGLRFPLYVVIALLFALIAAPIVLKLSRDLSHAKVVAALQAERADVAAHLHDSVLQALTMIRTRAGDAEFVERVARAQERDLRAWLYDTAVQEQRASSTQAAIRDMISELEDTFGADISLVLVGDNRSAGNEAALVAMLREAVSNAIRHGKAPYSVYVELGKEAVTAFVRDRGEGFELENIPADRHGVRESIIARAQNLGGTAHVKTGNGTEIRIAIPAGGYAAAPAKTQAGGVPGSATGVPVS